MGAFKEIYTSTLIDVNHGNFDFDFKVLDECSEDGFGQLELVGFEPSKMVRESEVLNSQLL